MGRGDKILKKPGKLLRPGPEAKASSMTLTLNFRPDIMKVGRSCRMRETNQAQEAQDGKDGWREEFCGD
jgi:hypothetical protein